MYFKIFYKGKKKKMVENNLWFLLKKYMGDWCYLVYILCNIIGFVVDINFFDFNGNNYIFW